MLHCHNQRSNFQWTNARGEKEPSHLQRFSNFFKTKETQNSFQTLTVLLALCPLGHTRLHRPVAC